MMMEALCGDSAPDARRESIDLIKASVASGEADEVAGLRRMMCSPGGDTSAGIRASAELWRYLQVRQLFRLALEGMFDWVTLQLRDRPRTSAWLVAKFMQHAPRRRRYESASEWFRWRSKVSVEPPDLIEQLAEALATRSSEAIVPAVSDALSYCLTACSYGRAIRERDDRLPLAEAHFELSARSAQPATDAIRHVLESWVVAQHVYWAVGRGLADARAGGKRILRLKVVLEERGWALTPGAMPTAPRATGDRLEALHQLLKQCRAFGSAVM
jgi:hypothetical protein